MRYPITSCTTRWHQLLTSTIKLKKISVEKTHYVCVMKQILFSLIMDVPSKQEQDMIYLQENTSDVNEEVLLYVLGDFSLTGDKL